MEDAELATFISCVTDIKATNVYLENEMLLFRDSKLCSSDWRKNSFSEFFLENQDSRVYVHS